MQLFQEKYWAIDYGFAKRIEPLIIDNKLEMLAGFTKPKELEKKIIKAGNLTEDDINLLNYMGASIAASVLVIPIVGSTTAHGEMCTTSTTLLERVIDIANNADEVKGIIFHMDTPGGAVTGMARFANKIKSSKKPIGTVVEGMMCSGGVYSSAHTDFIFVEDANSTTLGSLGVLQVLVDESEALEKAGIKVMINRGPKSSNKARGNSIEGYSEEWLAEELKVLGKIEADFHKVVKAGRPTISDQIFADEAKVYTGGEGIKLGLADKLGTLDEAIQLILDMNGKRKKYSKPVKYGF
jgi:protease-4